MGGVGGPCDFSVSPSPFGLDFGTLDFGTSDLGLTIYLPFLRNTCISLKTTFLFLQDKFFSFAPAAMPRIINLYGGVGDQVTDDFGFKIPICSERDGGFTAEGR